MVSHEARCCQSHGGERASWNQWEYLTHADDGDRLELLMERALVEAGLEVGGVLLGADDGELLGALGSGLAARAGGAHGETAGISAGRHVEMG